MKERKEEKARKDEENGREKDGRKGGKEHEQNGKVQKGEEESVEKEGVSTYLC